MIDGYWLPSYRIDPRAIALYMRHYSSAKNGRKTTIHKQGFTGIGEVMVLLTVQCDALFVWNRSTIERADGQTGVNCSVFRNEGSIQSSALIREACDLAWNRWPNARLFTYVDPSKIRSVNPGACFKFAGFRTCGESKRGLVILERYPDDA